MSYAPSFELSWRRATGSSSTTAADRRGGRSLSRSGDARTDRSGGGGRGDRPLAVVRKDRTGFRGGDAGEGEEECGAVSGGGGAGTGGTAVGGSVEGPQVSRATRSRNSSTVRPQ